MRGMLMLMVVCGVVAALVGRFAWSRFEVGMGRSEPVSVLTDAEVALELAALDRRSAVVVDAVVGNVAVLRGGGLIFEGGTHGDFAVALVGVGGVDLVGVDGRLHVDVNYERGALLGSGRSRSWGGDDRDRGSFDVAGIAAGDEEGVRSSIGGAGGLDGG